MDQHLISSPGFISFRNSSDQIILYLKNLNMIELGEAKPIYLIPVLKETTNLVEDKH